MFISLVHEHVKLRKKLIHKGNINSQVLFPCVTLVMLDHVGNDHNKEVMVVIDDRDYYSYGFQEDWKTMKCQSREEHLVVLAMTTTICKFQITDNLTSHMENKLPGIINTIISIGYGAAVWLPR